MRTGKLYGVGVGPGDPELLTLKARRVLNHVDVIFTPVSKEGKESVAFRIVRDLLRREPRVLPLHFPMVKDRAILERRWEEAVEAIYGELKGGKDAAFITLGDPLLYSTYVPLLKGMRRLHPDVEVETVPGVPSVLACLSEENLPLVEEDDKLAILPVTYGFEELRKAVEEYETVVLMKVPKRIDSLIEDLERLGVKEKAIFLSRCGQREFFSSDLESMRGETVDYLSLVVIKRRGVET